MWLAINTVRIVRIGLVLLLSAGVYQLLYSFIYFFLFWVVQGDISVFCCLKVTYFFVILLFFIQSVKFISIIRLLITTNFPNSCHCVCLIIPSLKYQTTNLKRTLFHPHTNQTKSTFHNIQKPLHTFTNFFKILPSLTAYSSRRCIED